MFRIEMLPAAHGDCLWIEYGRGPQARRILIDGGPAHTYPALRERILHLPTDQRRFELLVVTHIDSDHIGGMVKLLADSSFDLKISDAWFNGHKHLPDIDGIELLSRLREIDGFQSTPAIMVSAAVLQQDIDRALAKGFMGYWTKPLDIDRALAQLDDVLGHGLPGRATKAN